MNHYFITGTSRGLGKALATGLLENETNRVTGLSRECTITHPHYRHVEIDLNDLGAVKNFTFEDHPGASRLVLINNAGTLGGVKPVGKADPDMIIQSYHVNLVAPSLLTNTFVRTYAEHSAEKFILNISSGAGKNPIDGWSTYCASKAAIDLYSRVIKEEQQHTENGFRIWSVAPGVVDTSMQEEIRSASPEDFKQLGRFVDYHITKQLAHPETVARKYFTIFDEPDHFQEVVFSVKDL